MSKRTPRLPRTGLAAALLAGLLLALPTRTDAHEVPADVTVQAYLKPEGQTLRMLVRVPLNSMRDFDWPLVGPGFLDLTQIDDELRDAAVLWIADYVQLFENGTALPEERVVAARLSLPSDRSYTSYEGALAHITGTPLPPETELYWEQAILDVMLEVPISSAESVFAIDPALAHLGIQTQSVIHFLPPGGGERVFQYEGNPGRVQLDPRWYHAAFTFTKLGFFHILEGIDHLLFLLCLVIPFRRFRGLVPVVTAFTVAHSITLIASAFGFAPNALWFPPLIETLIALSIVFMAFENIVGANLQRRWIVAFVFGLVHGFGFSFLLRESLQFAGTHLVTSLVAFNVGVELGQLLILLLTIPVLELLFRTVVAERVGVILLSALVAHTGWHWMTERGGQFLEYDFALPPVDAFFVAAALRWLVLLLISGGVVWLLSGLFAKLGAASEAKPTAEVEG